MGCSVRLGTKNSLLDVHHQLRCDLRRAQRAQLIGEVDGQLCIFHVQLGRMMAKDPFHITFLVVIMTALYNL